MSTYIAVPDLTSGRPKTITEKDALDFLAERCEWREGQKSDKDVVYTAYAAWERTRHGMPVAARAIERCLIGLGFYVDGPNIFGLFLRPKDSTPAPPQISDAPSLPGGNAAPVNPDLYAANGLSMQMPSKPEPIFVEAGPMPWARDSKTKGQ